MVWRNLVRFGLPSVRVDEGGGRKVPAKELTVAHLFSYKQWRDLQSNQYNQSRGATEAVEERP